MKKVISKIAKVVKRKTTKKAVKQENVELESFVCAECNGRGLKDSETLCATCAGSGKA